MDFRALTVIVVAATQLNVFVPPALRAVFRPASVQGRDTAPTRVTGTPIHAASTSTATTARIAPCTIARRAIPAPFRVRTVSPHVVCIPTG